MGEAQLPAGTLTFFFSDVEGSTRAATALGPAFAPALEQHRRTVRAALAAAGGREVSTAGDSFFAVFPSTDAALEAAVAVQRAAHLADGFRARIGIHAGQAVVVGDDYIGLDVHRASRIADAGHGGQILLSEAALASLGGSLADGLRLRDLGRHRLKDVGPVRLWEVQGDGLPAGPFPPPRSLEAHPTNLPAAGPLIGREAERTELADLIERSSVVTVTGPGGIGKSRLAVEVARSLVERFPDGVFHVDLASTPDAASAIGAIGDVLGFRAAGEEPSLAALLDRLRDRDLLFVLDTADRVAGLPGLLASVAAACRRIRVLVSSRSRLRIAAEREYPVGPLPPDAAVELFARRAADVQAGFALDDRNRAAVARLVDRLDRIPLAIELAAARVRLFSPAALLDRLERRLPALGEGGADAPDRQRTLEAAIAWSCELLSPAEQSAFAQLGVFAGPFDLAAVEAVVEARDGADPLSVLEQLVDRSLVAAADQDGADHRAGAEPGRRFRLLAPIREFAAAALRLEGSEGAVRDRHARHFLDVARPDTQMLGGDAELEAIARLGFNESEFRAALDWCQDEAADPDRAAIGFELAARLGRYWHVRGQVTEGLARLTRSLALDIQVPPEIRARALHWAGVLHDDAGQTDDASRRLEEALALRRELGDDVEVAHILNSLGVVARSMGDLPRAEELLQESLQRKAVLGDRRGTAVSLSNLGLVAADQGRTDAAVDLLRRALEIDEEVGGTAVIIGSANLGAVLIRAGRHAEGLAQLRRALPGLAELADPELVIEALVAIAEAAHATVSAGAAAAEPWPARLLVAADRIRDTARVRLHDADRLYLADLRARVLAGIDPERLRSLEAEAGAVDVDAGLALAREALDQLAPG